MSRRFILAALGSVLTMALFAGCQCGPRRHCWRPFQSTCPNRCAAPACPTCPGGQLPPPGPVPSGPLPPPGMAPAGVAPAGVSGLPPAPEPTPSNIPGAVPGGAYNPGPGAAAPNTGEIRNYPPSTSQYTWQSPNAGSAPNAGVRLSSPDPVAAAPTNPDNVRLKTPEPPPANPPETRNSERRAGPPVTIPSFSVVVPDRIASGLKPTALAGLDWLQQNGYHTVINVVKAGEKDSDRKAIENRGLKYLTIEVSTTDLGKAVAEFNRILADHSNDPVFVYDRDGSLAGALWYLHFVSAGVPADEALTRAKSLGLRVESNGSNAALWNAIRAYLAR